MSIVGFHCPSGFGDVRIDTCVACQKPCYPLPLLLALLDNRPNEPDVWHVTEILNPPQIVWLSRHNDVYAHPESLLWLTFGKGWHEVLEHQKHEIKRLGLEDKFIFEQSISQEYTINGKLVTLTGRADLYIPETKTLWDYKTVKGYFARKVKKSWDETSYHKQLNIYRVIGFPNCEHMKLLCLIKDHSEKMSLQDGINEIEAIDVPMIPDSAANKMIVDLLTEHVTNEADCLSVRPCLPEETWMGRRCAGYCQVSDVCKQYQEKLNGGNR